ELGPVRLAVDGLEPQHPAAVVGAHQPSSPNRHGRRLTAQQHADPPFAGERIVAAAEEVPRRLVVPLLHEPIVIRPDDGAAPAPLTPPLSHIPNFSHASGT